MEKQVEIFENIIPYNHPDSKYPDMSLTRAPGILAIIKFAVWVFGKKLQKNNSGHDDFTVKYVIQKGAAKETYEDSPTLTPYIAAGSKTSVVIAPGGAFCNLSIQGEGEYIAKMLNANGISAFVLSYRLQPYRFPIPCLDAQRAVRWVRHHAQEYGLCKDSVGVMGFSAGGFACTGSAIFLGNAPICAEGYIPDAVDTENGMPDYIISMYPVADFDTCPNMLANLKGHEFYSSKQKREKWMREYALTDHFENAAHIPQFICYGTRDNLCSFEKYAEKVARYPNNKVCVLDGAGHGFGGSPKWSQWEQECVSWINAVTNQPCPGIQNI